MPFYWMIHCRPDAAAKGIHVCNSFDVFAFANQKTMQYPYPKDDMYPPCVYPLLERNVHQQSSVWL